MRIWTCLNLVTFVTFARRELGMPEELHEQYEQLSSEEQDQLKGAVHGLPGAEGKLEHNTMNSWITDNSWHQEFSPMISFPEQDIMYGHRQSMTVSVYRRDAKSGCARSWYRGTGFATSSKSLSPSILGRSEWLLIWWEDNDFQLQHHNASHCPGERWIIWHPQNAHSFTSTWTLESFKQFRNCSAICLNLYLVDFHRRGWEFYGPTASPEAAQTTSKLQPALQHVAHHQELVQAHQRSCCAQSWPGQNRPSLLSFAWNAFKCVQRVCYGHDHWQTCSCAAGWTIPVHQIANNPGMKNQETWLIWRSDPQTNLKNLAFDPFGSNMPTYCPMGAAMCSVSGQEKLYAMTKIQPGEELCPSTNFHLVTLCEIRIYLKHLILRGSLFTLIPQT